MSNELAVIAPQNLNEVKEMSLSLSKASVISSAFRGNPADVMAVVMAGAELGLLPMQALRGIVMIEGKPTLSADAMAALVMARGDLCEYLRCVKTDATVAVYETKRKGHATPTEFTFSIADAERAGLKGKGNWSKYPAAMLRARALSGIARMVYPDILMGVYDPDELESSGTLMPVGAASPAPRASPPSVDAEFRDPLESALTEFQSRLASCISVPEMEALWKASPKGSAEQQARMTTLYKARKAELTAAPTAAPEESK